MSKTESNQRLLKEESENISSEEESVSSEEPEIGVPNMMVSNAYLS